MDVKIFTNPVTATLVAEDHVLAAVEEALRVFNPSAEHTEAYKAHVEHERAVERAALERRPAPPRPRWASDGYVRFARRTPTGLAFPAGLTWRAASVVRHTFNAAPQITWPTRSVPPIDMPELRDLELRSEQLAVVHKTERARRILIEMPVRSGKTEVGFAILTRNRGRTLWIATRRGLVDQTAKRWTSYTGQLPGVLAGSSDTRGSLWGPVVFATLQTLVNVSDAFFRDFDAVVWDEAHHAGAETAQDVLARCVNAELRVGLSATTDTGDPVVNARIEGALGPRWVGSTIDKQVAAGYVTKPQVVVLCPPDVSYPLYTEIRDVVCPRWRENPLQLKRLGTQLFSETYRRGITNNEWRNAMIVLRARHLARAGKKVLVLCRYVKHAEGLEATVREDPELRVTMLSGDASDAERSTALRAFSSAPAGAVLVATPFFREGLDVPAIDAGILAGGGESAVDVIQSLGRMLTKRPGKNVAEIYDFRDGASSRADAVAKDKEKDYLGRHYVSRVSVYRAQGFDVEVEG